MTTTRTLPLRGLAAAEPSGVTGRPKPNVRAETATERGVKPLSATDDDTAPISIIAHLVCVAGPDLGRTFRVDSSVQLGRAVGPCLHAPDVSREHARITNDGSGYVLEDLGSSNGTLVNGVRVRERVTLHIGDRIQLGSTILVLSRHDELQERMLQVQRLEAMGALVGGLGHDFNNILMAITAGLEELHGLCPPSDEAATAISDLRQATTSGANLVKRLVALGRGNPVVQDTFFVADLVSETLTIARPMLGFSIRVRSEVARDAVLRGSRDEFQQLLLNLVINARDAMPSGGAIDVSARVVTVDKASSMASHLPSAGQYVELTVRDCGNGMDDATLARAFEPFFTTKGPGRGTGLGLATTYATVRRHGGAVSASSTVGRGTSIRILLPQERAPGVRSSDRRGNTIPPVMDLRDIDAPTIG